jgi:hypothetical protein
LGNEGMTLQPSVEASVAALKFIQRVLGTKPL